jgi:hypothetical protein
MVQARMMPGSDANDGRAICRNFGVVGNQAQRLCQGLSYKDAVEGVGVQMGKVLDGCGVFRKNTQ